MSWLYLAILSYFLFAIVFVLDKVLVKKVFSPLNYVLIVGGLQGLSVFLIPFVDLRIPNASIIAVAFLGGTSFIFGLYLYYKILLKYETTWVVPLLFGVFVPIVSFIFGYFLLGEKLNFFQIIAFILLMFGGVIISFGKRYDAASILILFFSGLFTGAYFAFLKIVFNYTNFWSGYILSGTGGFLTVAVIFLIVYGRRLYGEKLAADVKLKKILEIIFSGKSELFILKQVISFVANFILLYSISIGSLILVNGLGGMRYIFLLVLAVLFVEKWPKIMDEPLSFWIIIRKLTAIFLVIFAVVILSVQPAQTPGAKIWGADFTPFYSNDLGLDAKKVLESSLDDLKIREFRLSAYWPEIEQKEGAYDFSNIDWQTEEIAKRGGKIILAIGKRLPRWPECHEPKWAKNLKESEKNEKLLKYAEAAVSHFKNNKIIWAWQVENEPFLWGFGECPYINDEFFDKEISLVRSLDNRPIILTDSGEFGWWFRAYKRADIFGTTMYRVVLGKWWPFGYFKYPLTPDFFKIKLSIMEMIFGKKPAVNIELQAEPWLLKRPPNVSLEEQLKAFNIGQFKENIEYARQVGFEKNYLWGLEWWYWMKEKRGYPEFWEEARKLYNK